MKSLKTGLKREYWEYHRLVLGIPAVLSALVFVAVFFVLIAQRYDWIDQGENAQLQQQEQQLESAAESAPFANSDLIGSDERDPDSNKDGSGNGESGDGKNDEDSSYDFIAVYIGLGWLAGLYYLLSSLYTDRKDNSVLFWKSMPVSETQNVLTKLLFGALAFAAVALAVAWLMHLILTVLGVDSLIGNDGGESWQQTERNTGFSEVVLYPIVGLVFGVIWGLPIFTYTLMVSAMARRSPFILFILPLVVLAVLENIFFGDSYLVGFLFSHFPFDVLERLGESAGLADFFAYYFRGLGGASMLLGLILAAVFLRVAIWYRDNRFET